jgi:hypothetical protein
MVSKEKLKLLSLHIQSIENYPQKQLMDIDCLYWICCHNIELKQDYHYFFALLKNDNPIRFNLFLNTLKSPPNVANILCQNMKNMTT